MDRTELKARIREPYAWPGGYEVLYITSDGEILCNACVKANLRTILTAQRDPTDHSGWRIDATDTTEMCESYTACAQCNRTIVEQTMPDEGDIVTRDYHSFYQYGKLACYVITSDNWQPIIRYHMKLNSYWPSVWFEDDHGGYTLLNVNE
jgi:hypothetical protein